MGLQVWLPLNGNLANQGLTDVTAINNGATIDNNGKIGKCYSFDGSDDFINLGSIGSFFDGSAFSICFWIYSLENKTRAAVFSSYGLSSTSNFFGLELNSSNGSYCNNNLRFDWLGSDTYSPADFITYNAWTHVCVTYDGINKINMYKNGELIQTSTRVLNSITVGNNYYLGRDSRTGTTAFSGKLNDFRIYDHCLSPREVKEISKGLVLHYPLSMPGQENLLQGSRMDKNTTKNWEWYGVNNTINRKFDNDAYYFETNDTGTVNNSYCMRVDRNAIGVQVGDTLTVSMDIRGTIAGESYLQIMSTTPSSTNFWAYSTRGTNPCSFGNTIKEDVFQRYSLTFTLPESHSTNTYFYIFPSIGFNSHIWYRNVKLERGSIATPWIPKIIGQDNLFDFEPVASKWTAESCTVADYFDNKWGNALQITTTQVNQRIYRNVTNVWEANQKYTVSFIAKATTPIQCDMSRSIADFSPTFNLNTEWRRYTGIINCTGTTSGGTLSFRLLTAGTVYITNITLEKGDTTSAYDGFDNTEYDVSGYGYNGTKVGTITYDSDTPRYNVSSVFNGTEQIKTTTPSAEILTLSCWAKTSKNKSTSQFIVADSTSGLCITFYSGCIISYFGSGNQGTGSKCTLGDAYRENDWNHFVVVKTGVGTRKIYCNGVEQTATSNDYWGSAAGFFVSGRNSSVTLPFYGKISDVRAYATALSADDVLELYHTPISLSNNGTLLTQGELVES